MWRQTKGPKAFSVNVRRCESVLWCGSRDFKDDEGENLRIRPGLLVVPPALEDEANYLMTADRFQDNTPNIYKGTAKVLVWPGLVTDTEWYLFDATKPVKPLVYQGVKSIGIR